MSFILVGDLLLDVDLGAQIFNLSLCMQVIHRQTLYLTLHLGIFGDHRSSRLDLVGELVDDFVHLLDRLHLGF